jgi:hypothetical protein
MTDRALSSTDQFRINTEAGSDQTSTMIKRTKHNIPTTMYSPRNDGQKADSFRFNGVGINHAVKYIQTAHA